MINPFSSPSSEEALSFAVMLSSGVPPEEAILYFKPDQELDPYAWAKSALPGWLSSPKVKNAILQTQGGKEWTELSLDQKIRLAVDKNYTEMAYFLYSHNYSTLVGSDKQKADTCRAALEAKLAGSAGKKDALTQFFDDITSGKLKLTPSSPKAAEGAPLGATDARPKVGHA